MFGCSFKKDDQKRIPRGGDKKKPAMQNPESRRLLAEEAASAKALR